MSKGKGKPKKLNTSDGLEAVVKTIAKGKAVELSPKLQQEADMLMEMKKLIAIHKTSTLAVNAFREKFTVSLPTAYQYYHKAVELLQTTNPIKDRDINVNILLTFILEALHNEMGKTKPNNGIVEKLVGRYDNIIEKYMGDSEAIDWDDIKRPPNILQFNPVDFGYANVTNPNELKEKALRWLEQQKAKENKVLDIDFEDL
ncbi:MAG: hypothetical protein MUF12_08505 [Sediminibacterium sp.]|nr:hypothetical protein [Sediminibacterium sp.]